MVVPSLHLSVELHGSEVLVDGQKVGAGPLDSALVDLLNGVILCVVDIAVGHVGHVNAMDVAEVLEYPEFGVGGHRARLEDFLADHRANLVPKPR